MRGVEATGGWEACAATEDDWWLMKGGGIVLDETGVSLGSCRPIIVCVVFIGGGGSGTVVVGVEMVGCEAGEVLLVIAGIVEVGLG